ncbi:MAG: adenylate kinase [Paludibacteraceae bacterium]|nr:adenylate kinase [Paludibacteraceae bacterium]OPZ01522.1 MAG: Adenylate kinase [Bacteroidetes bacterium ADurb.BinA395]MBP8967110.1 adenylate kinase [Paludibacteraceae bacterium]HOF98064.1 adenylate kinase [Paludibacteraceae bacterium]HOR38657.1 adenylate kinase [Paludibacteraceae bacterium]
MLNIVICGAPGSGKGTQSKLIAEKYNLKHLSTGDMLRNEIKLQTEIGKKAEEFISRGQLVPDEMIIAMLDHVLDKEMYHYKGIILDGFPRTYAQAEALEKLLKKRNEEISLLLDLKVNDEELISRLLKRAEISNRSDDKLDVIRKRLEIYYQNADEVNNFYKKTNKYVAIEGIGTVEEIFSRISQIIDSKINS